MTCQQFHLINDSSNCNAIIQGNYFSPENLTLLYPSDVSTAIPYGTIRNNYEDDSGTELAVFSYLPLIYYDVNNPPVIPDYIDTNDALGKTIIPFYLPSTVTREIPYTKYQNEDGDEPTKRNCWLYEIGITLDTGENLVLIANSFVQVIPHV